MLPATCVAKLPTQNKSRQAPNNHKSLLKKGNQDTKQAVNFMGKSRDSRMRLLPYTWGDF